jgi:hypothetical protein
MSLWQLQRSLCPPADKLGLPCPAFTFNQHIFHETSFRWQIEQLFYTNIKPNMCYAEDIFYAKCNHWSAQPQVYHKCGAASQPDYHYTCHEKKTTGSRREDSFCMQCRFDPEKTFENQGTWLSVSNTNGKTVVKERFQLSGIMPERAGTPDLRADQRRPSDFLSGRVGL